MKTKTCSACKKTKTVSQFTNQKRYLVNGDSYYAPVSTCKSCRSTATRKWQKENIEKTRKYMNAWHKKKYWEDVEESRRKNRERYHAKKKAVHKH